MTRRRRICLALARALLVLVVDQISKAAVLRAPELRQGGTITIIPDPLNLAFTENTGFTFGMFSFRLGYVVLVPATLAVIGVLTAWLFRTSRALIAVAGGAILGGALSNLIDRVRYG